MALKRELDKNKTKMENKTKKWTPKIMNEKQNKWTAARDASSNVKG